MSDRRILGDVQVIDLDHGIRRIRFSHPAHNSMPSNLLQKLANTITTSGKLSNIRVIILESDGDRTFCAGASFDELISIQNFAEGKAFFMGFANVINACRTCPKMIIGRVQGKAVGGGVGLASAVDYCFASKYASIKLSELALGIGPFVVGPAVERKMGLSAMSQLAINASTWKTASWAMEKGLYTAIYDSNEELEEEVLKLARLLSTYSPEASAEMKKVLWQDANHWNVLLEERAELSGRLILTQESKSAIDKIKNRV